MTEGNGNLVVSDVIQFEDHFYAAITEKDSGCGAFALVIDPTTTATGYEPGPIVTWNLRYGMMTGPMRFNAPGDPIEHVDGSSMTVNAEEAMTMAQAKLDTLASKG